MSEETHKENKDQQNPEIKPQEENKSEENKPKKNKPEENKSEENKTTSNTKDQPQESIQISQQFQIPNEIKIDTKIRELVYSKLKNKKTKTYSNELYISSPQIIESSLSSYLVFTLTGSLIPDPIERTLSDFVKLRMKMVERWPGLYIPGIPSEKSININKPEEITFVMKMINYFLSHIAKKSYLFSSEEFTLFLSSSSNVGNLVYKLPKRNLEDSMNIFRIAFKDAKLEDIKYEEKDFLNIYETINKCLDNVRNFKDFVNQNLRKKNTEMYNFVIMLKTFYEFENNSLDLLDNKEKKDKLIFKNQKFEDNFKKIKDELRNPYIHLLYCIQEEEFDLISMHENLQKIYGIKTELDNLKQKTSELAAQIKKSKELNELVDEYEFKQKIKNKKIGEIGIQFNEEILRYINYNLFTMIDDYKAEKIANYYGYINKFKNFCKNNDEIIKNVWKEILENKNLSK